MLLPQLAFIAVEALKQLGVLDKVPTKALAAYLHPSVRNNRGEKVGHLRTVFNLFHK